MLKDSKKNPGQTSDGCSEGDSHDAGEGGGCPQTGHLSGRVAVHHVQPHSAYITQHHSQVHGVSARQQQGIRLEYTYNQPFRL